MSEIRATTISDAAGTGPITLTGQSAAKAWSNFDQFYTNTLRDSFNVSSAVDDAQGESLINLSNSMSNSSYVTVNSAATNTTLNSSNYNRVMESVAASASQVDCITYAPNNGTIIDYEIKQLGQYHIETSMPTPPVEFYVELGNMLKKYI